MLYGKRANGKAQGVVNTKSSVVAKMLDLVNFTEDIDLKSTTIFEPSAGEGAFAIEIIKRLYKSSIKHDFDFQKALSHLYLCELNAEIFETLKTNVSQFIEELGFKNFEINFIHGDFLQIDIKSKFDLIIGNPPYVRNENIPKDLKSIYQNNFLTFSHRSDLYIPFYEKSLNHLSPSGILSFVCSNRWLKNQYGRRLRELVAKNYSVDCIIDLEEANIFEEEVLGYPAITNISNKKISGTSPYFKIDNLPSLLNFNTINKPERALQVNSSNWFSFEYTGSSYEKNLDKIEKQNYKIGIGVATGRDSIFIGKQIKDCIEKELIIPILTSKDVSGSEINWRGNYLINPFDQFGKLIDLNNFPKARAYFNLHKEELSKRHIAKKTPSKWYRTIDKVHYNLTIKPKVILPDISGNKFIHVDKGNFYPHHNLYYIIGGSYDEMCLIASILMSDFVYEQLLNIGNKMNGGYPRWQSQNLRKLLIPNISSIPETTKLALLNAYHEKNINEINQIITKKKIAEFEISEGQLALFEPQIRYK